MNRFQSWRINFLIILIFLAGGVIAARLFQLQILKYNFYNELAQGQYQFFQNLFPKRGEIFIQDLKSQKSVPLAINKEWKRVYAVPRNIEVDKENLSQELAGLLNLDKQLILNRLNKPNDPYEPLKQKIDDDLASKIEQMNTKGIELAPEISRYYPGGSLASHLVGFVGISTDQKTGQYGLEGSYERDLKGVLGSLEGEKDTAGRWIPTVSQSLKPAEDGLSLVLTIDQNIQFKAEKELKELVEKYKATEGTVIIMNPNDGAIYAMASLPNFDPNNYFEADDINVFLNPAIQKIYEPGSVMKPFTVAAGLDSGSITFNETFEDKGFVALRGGTIRNALDKSYGQQTMAQILEKSINTGAVYVQQKMDSEKFRDYLQAFGFGQTTGIDLSGELAGNISNLFTDREIDLATVSFGQGIAVTPLQLITAISAIANGGKLIKPHIVSKTITNTGQETMTQIQEIRQVISAKTAQQVTQMLVGVVDRGHSGRAKIEGYNIAGKTGTAEVPNPDKPGYLEETIHTFIGFAPAFDPKFAILVKLEKPQGVNFADTSVTPVFRNLAKYLLDYFEIPPSLETKE